MANTDMRRRLAMMLGDCPVTIKGVAPITTTRRRLLSLKAFGGTEQNGTPTPDAPVDIVSNNGVLKLSRNLLDTSSSNLSNYDANNGVLTYNDLRYSYILDMANAGLSSGDTITLSCTSRGTSSYWNVGAYERITEGQAALYYNNENTVLSKLSKTFTIPNGAHYIVVFNGSGYAENQMIELGSTATPYTPYSPTGVYADGTVETINVHGKNLFNTNEQPVAVGPYYGVPLNKYNTGNYWLSMTRKQGVAVPSGSIGIVFKRSDATSTAARWFVSNGTENSFYMSNGSETNFISLSDVDYIAFAVYPANNTTWTTFMDAYNIQIEQGTRMTEYESYYDGGTATAEMLLKVGDYQDVQSVLDGAVTRNVGVKVLDGTEPWVSTGTAATIDYLVEITKMQFAPDIDTSATYNKFLCSHLKMGNNDEENTLIISTYARNGIRLGLNTDITGTEGGATKIANVKQWLADQYTAGTPVIVVYPLATPATEQVAGQTLALTSRTNVIDITQASLDNLELEVKVK